MTATGMSTHRPMRVGLTGGIASGKSLVARLFRGLGVPVIDTDDLARVVVAPGTPGLERLVGEFGVRILKPDGTLDRPVLRTIVFSDTASRRRLEEILQPLILAELEAALAAWQVTGPARPYINHAAPQVRRPSGSPSAMPRPTNTMSVSSDGRSA